MASSCYCSIAVSCQYFVKVLFHSSEKEAVHKITE